MRTALAACLACVALALAAVPSVASAAAGDLDPSFSGDGIAIDSSTGGAGDVAIDSSGRIVVLAGDVVLGFRPNGRLDKSFSGDGRAHVPFGGANAIATDAQDRVVVGGVAPNPKDTHHRLTFAVGRLKADGSPDPSFSGDGQVVTPIGGGAGRDVVTGVAIDHQGRIVAAGWSYRYSSGNDNFAVARYLANGKADSSFSGDGQTRTQFPDGQDAAGTDVAIDSKGRIVVAGSTLGPESDDFGVARYTPAGNLDASFSQDGTLTTPMTPPPGGYAQAKSVAIDDLDRIVVAGDREGGDFALARYRPNGALDPAFSGDGKAFTSFGWTASFAWGVAIDDQERVVAAGTVTNFDSSRFAFALARFMPGGALDPGFSGDGRVTTSIGSKALCSGLALDSQGRILAAGAAHDHAVVARYLSG